MISAAEIRALLPHRYPMLLVDRVVHAVPGERLVAHKAVTVNEPWYADRGDDEDLGYPPSLLIESWGQAAAVLAGLGGGQWDSGTDKVFLFGSMSTVEFHGAVYPGDVLEHHVRVSLATGDTVIFEGSSEVRGERVLGVDRAVLALRPAGALAAPGAHR